MTANRFACIDVGSNTTALLVAEVIDGELKPIATQRHFTRVGDGATTDGISAEKLAAAEAAVVEFVEYARGLDVESVHLIATHVVRVAPNGHELAARLHERTGLQLDVISGDEEARFSFNGALGGVHRLAHPTVVIDAGGGSTEVSWCAPGEELVTASYPIGSAALQREFMPDDPPTGEEITAAREAAREMFSTLRLPKQCQVALAVGGGASTAQQLMGGVIDGRGIDRVLSLVAEVPSSEVAVRFSIEPNRARLLPAGLAILGALCEQLSVPLEVGRGGLREGVLLTHHSTT